MSDLEEGIDTPARRQVPSMPEDEEQEHQIHQVINLFMGSPSLAPPSIPACAIRPV